MMHRTGDDGVGQVARVAEALIARMDEATGRLGDAVAAAAPEGRPAVDAAVARVAQELLADDERLFGAGFVATAAFGGAEGRMAWWQARSGAERTIARLDSAATGAGDYQRDVDSVEWFHEPMASGAPHLTGPYVDYLCTDDLTMTYTVPADGLGGRLGVVGCDIAARTFEEELQAALDGLGGPAVVVTDQGRVVATTDEAALVMRRLAEGHGSPYAWSPIGSTPFRLGRR